MKTGIIECDSHSGYVFGIIQWTSQFQVKAFMHHYPPHYVVCMGNTEHCTVLLCIVGTPRRHAYVCGMGMYYIYKYVCGCIRAKHIGAFAAELCVVCWCSVSVAWLRLLRLLRVSREPRPLLPLISDVCGVWFMGAGRWKERPMGGRWHRQKVPFFVSKLQNVWWQRGQTAAR